MSRAAPSPPPLRTRAVHGVAWQSIGQGAELLLRLGTNAVLARLLLPGDFGLVGLVALGLAVADALAFTGTDIAILHHRIGARPRFLGTAWTLQIARAAILALALLLAAPLLARAFGHPEAVALFAVVAVQPLLQAATHPGAMVLVKRVRFARWTLARLLATVVGTGTSIALAMHWRSPWALLIGQLATTAAVAALSHRIAAVPTRPRWDPRAARLLLAFAAGTIGTPLLLMLVSHAPSLVLGSLAGATVLGAFLLNQKVTDALSRLVLQGIGLVAVPVYAELATEPDRLRRAWLHALRTVAALALPVGAALAWLDRELATLLFGPGYALPHGTLALLAVGGSAACLTVVSGPLFQGLGRPSIDRRAQLLRAGLLHALAWPLVVLLPGATAALGLGAAVAVSAGATAWLTLHLGRRLAGATRRDVGRALVPGLAVSAALVAVLQLAALLVDRGALVDAALAAGATLAAIVLALASARHTRLAASVVADSAGDLLR